MAVKKFGPNNLTEICSFLLVIFDISYILKGEHTRRKKTEYWDTQWTMNKAALAASEMNKC